MKRQERREQIFLLLFRFDFYPEEELQEQEDNYFSLLDEPLAPKDEEYIRNKAQAVAARTAQLDEIINAKTTGWKTSRMGKVDLVLIRLAVYEMEYDEDVPVGVAINEAVELAKKYGTDKSPAFVNGVLARIAG